MNHSQVAVRYAKSIYLLAKEKNLVKEIKNDIQLIESSLSAFPDLKEAIDNPVILPSVKKSIITDIFKDKINQYTYNFLILLIQNKRETALADIFRNFYDIYRKDHNIKKAYITSVDKLDSTLLEEIEKLMEEKFEAKIELEDNTNSSLIGGVVVRVEDKEYDYSIQGKLNKIKIGFEHISL